MGMSVPQFAASGLHDLDRPSLEISCQSLEYFGRVVWHTAHRSNVRPVLRLFFETGKLLKVPAPQSLSAKVSCQPPKADMCSARTHVCYEPIADISIVVSGCHFQAVALRLVMI